MGKPLRTSYEWTPWTKGIRKAIAATGYSMLECANWLRVDPEKLEAGIISGFAITKLEEYTGLSEYNIRRIGFDLSIESDY